MKANQSQRRAHIPARSTVPAQCNSAQQRQYGNRAIPAVPASGSWRLMRVVGVVITKKVLIQLLPFV